MSKSVLDPVIQLFRAPHPLWACEFTARHLIVAGVDSSRKRIASRTATPLPADVVAGSLSARNLLNPQAALDLTKETLRRAGLKGFEITVIIPDDSSRIAFLTADSLTGTDQDRETFVRWKLKKTVPFDVDSAQISYKVLGEHQRGEGKGVDIMVALSPRTIVQEYEGLLEKLDLHAGFVIPSTLATLNLSPVPSEDLLFVKIAPGSITTTVFQNQRPRFYRRVPEMPLYDAVYPTLLYYQDKLGGTALAGVTVCGYDGDTILEVADLQSKLGLPVRKAEPNNVEDIYKAALGAVDFIWAHSI